MLNRISTLLVLMLACTRTVAAPSAGFFLPDSVFEFSMKYKTIDNLIILPVTINDSVHVNLILDTGCRNMLLFGKRFEKMFQTQSRPVGFSGHGPGKPLEGKLSLNNHVKIEMVEGKRIPIIIMSEKNLFSSLPNVHGVIGYEIFAKFEIEFNFPERTITFRTASTTFPYPDFTYVTMKVVDSRPVLQCAIESNDGTQSIPDLMIDTGSSLGLLIGNDTHNKRGRPVGRGLGGTMKGETKITKTLKLGDVEFTNINTSIVSSERQYASIGMNILKDCVVIVNYAKSYVAFKNA